MDYLLNHISSILVGLLLLTVLFAFGFLQIRQCREPEKPTQKHNQPSNNPPIHADDQKTADENHRAAERTYWNTDIKIKNRPNWLGRFTTGFSAVAAIAAVVGYIEIERQIGIAQAGADASMEAAVQAKRQADAAALSIPRAWIQVSLPPGRAANLREGPPTERLRIFSFKVPIVLTNYGQVPAIITGVQTSLWYPIVSLIGWDFPNNPDINGNEVRRADGHMMGSLTTGTTIAAGKEVTSSDYTFLLQIPIESRPFLEAAQKWMLIVVKYMDPAGRGRETSYLTSLGPFPPEMIDDGKYTYMR